MKLRFNINDTFTNIPIILDCTIGDYMDGTSDTISFSFLHDTRLNDNVSLGEKCNLIVYDNDDEIIRTYYMIISDITSDLKSMYKNVNGFENTVMLKEHTILLKNCIRTDLAITPLLYPVDIYPTLKQALYKIIDCHNLPVFNEKILEIDDFLLYKLEKVACPTLNFVDLSTFDQLSDVLLRVGCVPYLENGKLFGLLLQGNRDKTDLLLNMDAISSLSSSKIEGVNYGILSSKVYNTVYDDEVVVVPSIFKHIVHNTPNNATFYDSETLEIIRVEEEQDDAIIISNFIMERMNSWTSSEVQKINSPTEDTFKLLSVSGYNPDAQEVYDPLEYNIQLPSKIEYVDSIYSLKPEVEIREEAPIVNVSPFGKRYARLVFKLERVDKDKLFESGTWNNLSSLQKTLSSYYVRGGNKINQPLSLIGNIQDLTKTWITSKGNLFNDLRKTFYIVKYKPMRTQTYSTYKYNKDNSKFITTKPKLNKNLNLPYKQVSDKQVSNILSYELQKKLDTTFSIKFITKDTRVLELTASDIVKIQDEIYIISVMNIIINNETIEVSITLNKNIIYNNPVSTYTDKVRVSSNLSTETLVTRDVPLFLENIIDLSISPKEQIIDFDKPRIPQELLVMGLFNLGLTPSQVNVTPEIINTKLSQNYRLKFNKIYGQDDPESINIAIIKYSPNVVGWDNDPLAKYYNTKFNLIKGTNDKYNFVSKSYKYKDIATFGKPENWVIDTDVTENSATYSFSTLDEVETFFTNVAGLYYSDIHLFPNNFILHGFSHNGVFLVPEGLKLKALVEGAITPSNFTVYPVSGVSTNPSKYSLRRINQLYNSNIVTTTSGNIFTLNYGFESEHSNLQKISVDSSNVAVKLSGKVGKIIATTGFKTYKFDTKIDKIDPIIYNSTTSGCLLDSIGTTYGENTRYEFINLPRISTDNYSLIVDMNEQINPYIQVITIPSKSSECQITEMNYELEWLSTYPRQGTAPTIKVFKIKEGNTINAYTYTEDIEGVIYQHSTVTLDIPANYINYTRLTFSNKIKVEKGWEYVLVSGTTPIFKFKPSREYTEIYLSSIISDNY